MLRRTAGLLAAAGALVALAGCTTDAPRPPTTTTTTPPRPTSVVEPTQSAQLAEMAALAELAEQAAAALPPPRTPPPRGGAVLGADVSWPQCPRGLGIPERRTLGAPMPLPQAEFVVVGLTNGPGFTTNPCLAEQVDWVRERHRMVAAYAVVSRPSDAQVREHGAAGPYDAGTDLGRLANTGYQQGLANVAAMRRAGLNSPVVWVDVEPVPDFEWSSDVATNGAVVQGAVEAYAVAGYRVGIYSTPALWEGVVGHLALGLPEWRAAGQTSRAEAERRCADDWMIQGGQAVLGQWVERGRDQNITCGDVHRDLGRWFHQF